MRRLYHRDVIRPVTDGERETWKTRSNALNDLGFLRWAGATHNKGVDVGDEDGEKNVPEVGLCRDDGKRMYVIFMSTQPWAEVWMPYPGPMGDMDSDKLRRVTHSLEMIALQRKERRLTFLHSSDRSRVLTILLSTLIAIAIFAPRSGAFPYMLVDPMSYNSLLFCSP